MRTLIVLTLLTTLVTVRCSRNASSDYHLGELEIAVSGSPEAVAVFKRGYLQLHSFEYADAAEAFQEAQQLDPGFAMAYWGEAMTYNHPLWQEQQYDKANEVLQRLGATPDERVVKATTELEKDFIRAINILYSEGAKNDRDKKYMAFMAELYDRYPGNHEIASFYALSILGSVPSGRDDEAYQQSARIVEHILKENPNHPGALHYYIHANDDPYHAATALFAANEYSEVAPDAAHALHMPTHIYVALGMWNKVVEQNEESWSAGQTRKERKQLTNDALGYHSLHWLEYGYLQQDRRKDAEKLLANMVEYARELPSARARTHEIYLKSTYLVETNWDSTWSSLETNADGLNISTRAMEHFVRGMRAFSDRNGEQLAHQIQSLEEHIVREEATVTSEGIAMCGSGSINREYATQTDVSIARVMKLELMIAAALLENNSQEAERLFKEATALEARTSYSYGPPTVVKPSFEWYGEFLLQEGRPEEAFAQFDSSLKRAPRRMLSLKGKLKAAEILADTASIDILRKEIEGTESTTH